MKLIATALVIALLTQSAWPQSNGASTNSVQAVETKQDKKERKAKAKTQREAGKSQAGDKGKKTTPTQDAAYAAAYKAGIPKQ